MARAANSILEVRTGAGNDANGGGYSNLGGVDYSQQNSPQYALTGLSTTGAGAVVRYASAVSDMLGNWCQVISGTNFTAGFYQITAISAGVSFTVDAACCTGAGSSGVINVGGALNTWNKAALAVVPGNQCYIKSSGLPIYNSVTIALSQNGGSGLPISWIGYGTVRGDGGRVSYVVSGDASYVVNAGGCTFNRIYNISMDCAGVTSSAGIISLGAYGHIVNCWIKNFTFYGIMANGTVDNCIFSGGTSAATAAIGGSYVVDRIRNCIFIGNATIAIKADNANPLYVTGCIFASNSGASSDGIWMNGGSGIAVEIANNIFDSCGRNGINCTTAAGLDSAVIKNNIFTRNGGYDISSAVTNYVGQMMDIDSNFFGSGVIAATSGARNKIPAGPNDKTVSVLPYNNGCNPAFNPDPTTWDFGANTAAGGGAVLRSAALLGLYSGTGTTSYADAGPVQHQDAAGGATTTIFIIED